MNDMNEQKSLTIQTTSAAATEVIGEAIGRQLRGGEVIELASDLGGGKTTLVRGLARGAGSSDHVASPTFTLSKMYQTRKFQIHHFDFYRLQEAGIMQAELQELVDDPETVVIVEWSDIVRSVLPDGHLTIRLVATGEEERQVTLEFPPSLTYLVEGIQ
jgi:tRNA threonylcarbamoyladenosine biosynthesis protein TsaE